MTVPVYFATSRTGIGSPPTGFGSVPGGTLTFGRADVTDASATADLLQPLTLTSLSSGTFWPALQDEIVQSQANHLFLYIHGFDYRFNESIVRAGQLGLWYGAGTRPLPSIVVAFCWPSLGTFSLSSYGDDYQRADGSGDAFRQFLIAMVPLIARFRSYPGRTRRVSLMAHSLGNHVLCVGLGKAIGTAAGQYNPAGQAPLFDTTILTASDEDADSLSGSDRLAYTAALSRRVYVYYNEQDIPLTDISQCYHHKARLGTDGPPDMPHFGASPYAFINCSVASPIDIHGTPLDPEHHQYYRLVPEVRDDMCGVMQGVADDQLVNRVYRPAGNDYRLNLSKPNPDEEFHH
ncbi:MAG TPA: alpha/beta hydrolase [Rhizomicrobium sp.]